MAEEVIRYCQPTAHRFAFSDSASLRVGQTRADSASLRLVPVMKSSHRGAPASPLTPSGVESSVSHGRRPLRESLDIRALPPSRRPRPSRERQTGVTGRFPVRRAEPTFLADEMSAPADFQVNDAVSEERTSGRSNALSVRKIRLAQENGGTTPWQNLSLSIVAVDRRSLVRASRFTTLSITSKRDGTPRLSRRSSASACARLTRHFAISRSANRQRIAWSGASFVRHRITPRNVGLNRHFPRGLVAVSSPPPPSGGIALECSTAPVVVSRNTKSGKFAHSCSTDCVDWAR